jgi:hypothetical protein
MQALLNLISNPGFTGVAGIVIGIVLNNYSVGRRERRRLEQESEERKAQWNREATERQEQRNHEERLMQSEAQDKSIRAYSRFLGMAHTVKHLAQGVSREDLRALAESYAEADVVTRSEMVRTEAYHIFSEALGEGAAQVIDTDDFIKAVRRELREEGAL